MRLRAGVASDRGLVRQTNEDYYLLRRGLYAVCDGMGGARAGEVASKTACRELSTLDPATAGPGDLRAAISRANEAIIRLGYAEEKLLGMGTTLTAALAGERSLSLAHVGDSRAYLLHEGNLIQLTNDHSWVGEMVRRGELTQAQAAVHPHRSVITRALGTESDADPDIFEVPLEPGDRVLLCSDGLTGMVPDAEIAEILRQDDDPGAVAKLLVQAALRGGGEDNITVVVIDVLSDGDTAEVAGGVRPAEAGDETGEEILLGPGEGEGATEARAYQGRWLGDRVRGRL